MKLTNKSKISCSDYNEMIALENQPPELIGSAIHSNPYIIYALQKNVFDIQRVNLMFNNDNSWGITKDNIDTSSKIIFDYYMLAYKSLPKIIDKAKDIERIQSSYVIADMSKPVVKEGLGES